MSQHCNHNSDLDKQLNYLSAAIQKIGTVLIKLKPARNIKGSLKEVFIKRHHWIAPFTAACAAPLCFFVWSDMFTVSTYSSRTRQGIGAISFTALESSSTGYSARRKILPLKIVQNNDH